MSEALVAGIITDTSNPEAVARLLADLAALASEDPGLSPVEVVLLENPSGEPAPPAEERWAGPLQVLRAGRDAQERDAARGRFGRVDLPPGRLPISLARTLVQRYASDRAAVRGAAVWILDEDMRLSPLLDAVRNGGPPLSERMRRLREEGADVAMGPVLGAPPLPARSIARVNLEDVARHLDQVDALPAEAAWPDRSDENARVRRDLPEYYYDLSRTHGDAGAYPMWLEPLVPGETVRSAFARLCDAVGGLLHGAPVTRPIVTSAEPPLLARGGSTLVLRPDLLARIPNVAPRLGGRTSRRSDMLWARLAVALEGARFTRAPLAVLHDRCGTGRSSFDAAKLLDDLRGSALVAAFDALSAEGELSPGRPPSRSALARASAIYELRVHERLAAIHDSEARARALLDRINTRTRAPDPGFLQHPVHATSIARLLDHAAALRAALDPGIGACDPTGERAAIEQFITGLPDELDAYRAGRCAR